MASVPLSDSAPLPGARRTLILAGLSHALHDGYTDAIYVLLPLWQSQFALSFGALFWWSIQREHLKTPLANGRARVALIRFACGNVGYAVAIGVAFLSAPASLPGRRWARSASESWLPIRSAGLSAVEASCGR